MMLQHNVVGAGTSTSNTNSNKEIVCFLELLHFIFTPSIAIARRRMILPGMCNAKKQEGKLSTTMILEIS